MIPKRLPAPMSAIRRQVFGERPLAPIEYPVVLWQPPMSWARIALRLALGAASLAYVANFVAGYMR